jgi:hypothetical protein
MSSRRQVQARELWQKRRVADKCCVEFGAEDWESFGFACKTGAICSAVQTAIRIPFGRSSLLKFSKSLGGPHPVTSGVVLHCVYSGNYSENMHRCGAANYPQSGSMLFVPHAFHRNSFAHASTDLSACGLPSR